MAKVTNLITKVLSDYRNSDLHVNFAIKYRFSYNGYYTDVFYTEEDGLSKQLVLSILIDGIAYITTLNFDKIGADYYMNFYVCHELFTKVSHSLFEKDGAFSTAPYFKAMSDYIVSHTPITTLHRKELKSYRCYSFTEENKPYFLTTRRGKMTPKMKEKIIKKYNKELAAKIFRICGTTRTLVFTSSVERSKDVEVYINNYSI